MAQGRVAQGRVVCRRDAPLSSRKAHHCARLGRLRSSRMMSRVHSSHSRHSSAASQLRDEDLGTGVHAK